MNLKKWASTPVANEQYPKDAKDFTAEILKIKQSGADALLLYIQNPSDTAIILKQIQSLGLGIPIVGSPSLEQPDRDGGRRKGRQRRVRRGRLHRRLQLERGDALPDRVLQQVPPSARRRHRFGLGLRRGVHARRHVQEAEGHRSQADDRVTKAIKNWEGVLGTFSADAEGNMVHSVSIGQIRTASCTWSRRSPASTCTLRPGRQPAAAGQRSGGRVDLRARRARASC